MVFVVEIHPTKILPMNYSSHVAFIFCAVFVHWSSYSKTNILIAMSLFHFDILRKKKAVHSYQLNPHGSVAKKAIPSSSIAAANVEVRSIITATTNS